MTVFDGIRVTTPSRTIVDLADFLGERQIERLIDEADYLGLPLEGLRPRPGRRGSGKLARVLASHDPGSTRTRSELEERMLALCRHVELPPPQVNERVHGYTADFVWRDKRLIVEAAGWRVVRITWSQLRREPVWVAERIRAAMG